MCKHILNAQVSIRAPCCRKWFDCPECHAENSDHNLLKTTEMTLACKKCKKVFRKDMGTFEESDEFCPRCDNHFVIEAKTPQKVIEIEAEDVRIDSRAIKDDRVNPDDEVDRALRDLMDGRLDLSHVVAKPGDEGQK
ncbi:hypothetical protein BT69DRAFT_1237262 [Atractiella rhizophila]|nr:hypothetical protein BT69DRAFT_1237262 [Atractiella rhizophila]